MTFLLGFVFRNFLGKKQSHQQWELFYHLGCLQGQKILPKLILGLKKKRTRHHNWKKSKTWSASGQHGPRFKYCYQVPIPIYDGFIFSELSLQRHKFIQHIYTSFPHIQIQWERAREYFPELAKIAFAWWI